MNPNNYLCPDWPAPPNIKAYTTTRLNGHSIAPFDSFNLAAHVEDNPAAVLKNRQQLITECALPHEPVWLKQVHGTEVIPLDDYAGREPTADAAFAQKTNRVCAVLTADCLPILICDKNGQKVAAIHGGWQGLLAGVIDATLEAISTPSEDLLVWLGPAIGPEAFEINEDIRTAFLKRDPNNEIAFHQHRQSLYGNLYQIARINLARYGIFDIHGGNFCTYQDDKRFYSYRRAQGLTGRMASLIWIQNP